jgi:hypothetical protein
MGGLTRNLAPFGFDGGIPDADRPRAKQIVTEITAEYGFETPPCRSTDPAHMATGVDLEPGAQYDFGTRSNTIMQVSTGCHLREAEILDTAQTPRPI